MSMGERQELLEKFKLHVGLADSISRPKRHDQSFLPSAHVWTISPLFCVPAISKWSAT